MKRDPRIPSYGAAELRSRGAGVTTIACDVSDAAQCDALVAAFHSPTLRVYANDDIVGVEVGGAVKNVLAIATGLCDGLQLGLNARAALITRGLAEITRLRKSPQRPASPVIPWQPRRTDGRGCQTG